MKRWSEVEEAMLAAGKWQDYQDLLLISPNNKVAETIAVMKLKDIPEEWAVSTGKGTMLNYSRILSCLV